MNKDALEKAILLLTENQKKFNETIIQLLSLEIKPFYSKEEAALFLNLEPEYLYQLKHQGKIKAYKKEGQRKLYFKKEDLVNYIISSSQNQEDEDFENEIVNHWNKER